MEVIPGLNMVFCFCSDGYGQSTADRYGGPPSGGQQGGQRSYGGGGGGAGSGGQGWYTPPCLPVLAKLPF